MHVPFDLRRSQSPKIKCGLTVWTQWKLNPLLSDLCLSSCNCSSSNLHFTLLSSPLGGPSVSAVKRSVSRPLPPAASSRLGRRRGQQSQLWHGHRSVCPPEATASRQSGRASHLHVAFVFASPLLLIREGQRILQVGRHGDCGDRLDSRVGPHQHHEGSQRPLKEKIKKMPRQDPLLCTLQCGELTHKNKEHTVSYRLVQHFW